MKTLQIIFLVSFAIVVLVVPYLIFSFLQGADATPLIIFLGIIFAVNSFFLIRKLSGLRKSKSEQK